MYAWLHAVRRSKVPSYIYAKGPSTHYLRTLGPSWVPKTINMDYLRLLGMTANKLQCTSVEFRSCHVLKVSGLDKYPAI